MAFNINPGKQQFTATASQTVFTFNFAIFATTDIKVYKTLAGAVANDTTDLLTISTHYTVSINGTLGGTVTLLSGAGVNDTVTLVRNLPVNRQTDYVTNGDLYADTLDADQDYQTYLVQDGYVQLERAIILPESVGNVDVNIPAPVANSYLRWNATADALENDTSIPNDVVTTNNNVALTNADVVLTHADVVLTHADVVLAQKWASELEDVVVSGGQFSAFHWALKAAASAAGLVIDATPTDGSANAVSSNGVFDALALKANSSSLSSYLALAGGTMTGAITALRETKVAMGANDINLASGNLFTKTISGATTLTVSNWLATGNANSFVLELTNGGSAVVTWFSGVKWAGGTAPTLTASGVDILGFYSHDGGTTVRGMVLSKDSK
jgi:hypothetical protein